MSHATASVPANAFSEYRPLCLMSYRPSPMAMPSRPNDGDFEHRRAERAARRSAKACGTKSRVRRSTSRSVTRSVRSGVDRLGIVVMVVATVATAVVLMTLSAIAPAASPTEPLGMSATLEGIEGEHCDFAMTHEAVVASEFVEPDISGECPVVWHQQTGGGFASETGGVLGSQNLFGVDVSSHNGEIDWEAAKAAGLDFAIIRCGFGADDTRWDDETWEYNASECERLGIPYGAYLYSYAESVDGAHTEASHVARLMEGHTPTLGVWYDIEELAQAEALGYDSDSFDQLVDLFAADVEASTGLEVGVYTSSSWLFGHMDKVREDAEHPIWCACWSDGAPTGIAYECWQAGAALMPGFSTEVDFDVILR